MLSLQTSHSRVTLCRKRSNERQDNHRNVKQKDEGIVCLKQERSQTHFSPPSSYPLHIHQGPNTPHHPGGVSLKALVEGILNSDDDAQEQAFTALWQGIFLMRGGK